MHTTYSNLLFNSIKKISLKRWVALIIWVATTIVLLVSIIYNAFSFDSGDPLRHNKEGLPFQMFMAAKVTILDTGGHPAPHAIVTLDKQQQMLADDKGVVYFQDVMLHDHLLDIVYQEQHYLQPLHIHTSEAIVILGMSQETRWNITILLTLLLTGWVLPVIIKLSRYSGLFGWYTVVKKFTFNFLLHKPAKLTGAFTLAFIFAGFLPTLVEPNAIPSKVASAQAIVISLAVPTDLTVEQDDNNAILSWNGSLIENPQDPPGVVGYRVSWGLAGQPLTSVQVTQFRALQLQPLVNGQQYQAQVQSVDANGNLSIPSDLVSFTGDPSRVNALRARMTGFFDDFNRPAGAFDELKWNQAFSRCSDENLNASFINNQFHAHNMISDLRCDRGQIIDRPRATFDFTGRTGTIAFDMDGLDRRNRWYLDLVPQLLDITGHISDDDLDKPGFPSRMLRFRQNSNNLAILYVGDDGLPVLLASTDYNPYPPLDELGLPLIYNVRRHWEIQVSQSQAVITVNGKIVLSASLNLPFSKATLMWNQFSYNTSKANQPYVLMHWDNFGFDGPASAIETHNYRTAGYGGKDFVTASDFVPINTQINIPDELQGALTQRLMFTLQMDNNSEYQWNSTDHVIINGQTFAIPQPVASPGNSAPLVSPYSPFSEIIELPKGTLVTGVNQLSFVAENSGIMNIHLEADFDNKKNVPAYTQPDQIYPTNSIPVMNEVGPGVSLDKFDATGIDLEVTPVYSLSGMVGVQWTAHHNIAMAAMGKNPGIAKVQIRLDQVVIYEINTNGAPYEQQVFNLDTTKYTNGPHKLDIVAYNPSGAPSIPDYFQSNTRSGDYYPVSILIDNPVPAAPTNLKALVNSNTQINLNWTDNSSNEAGFNIYRRVGYNGSYTKVAILPENSTGYQDSGLLSGLLYYYKLVAYNSAGSSVYSNEANALTPLDTPSNINITVKSFIELNLSWTNIANEEVYYQIERKMSATGTYSLVAQVSANTTNYSDIGLLPATTYYYRLRAISPYTSSDYVTGLFATTLPLADYTVTTTLDDGPGSLRDALNNIAAGGSILVNLSSGNSLLINTSLPMLKPGVTIAGNCTNAGPGISIIGEPILPSNAGGLVLSEDNVLYGLNLAQFPTTQIKAIGGSNRLKCVTASKN